MALVRERSTRKNDGMIDMLLTPLERMVEYKVFLDKLYSWTDPRRVVDYEFLGKASRRIGRVASYIEKYKYGIYNQNEMIKLQKFFKTQCDILAPERVIVRRGMMTRQTSGWTARKKNYIFFLFNDMLLWTNRNGKLKNAVLLKTCQVMPSSAKNDANRKFEITYRDKTNKILRLECENVTERLKWYQAFKTTISKAKKTSSLAWSRSASLLDSKYQEYSEDVSDEEQKTSDAPSASRRGSEDSQQQFEHLDDPYNRRYMVTSSFKIQEFKEIEPMDDNLSQISEQDVTFHHQNKYFEGKGVQTHAMLSPFQTTTKYSRRVNPEFYMKPVPENPMKEQNEIKKEEFVNHHGEKPNIIIRRSSSDKEERVRSSPRYTVSLNEF